MLRTSRVFLAVKKFRRLHVGVTVLLRAASNTSECPVHPDLLKVLVCPLSKAPLRYHEAKNELVCDKLGVGYPVLGNGVPNLYPHDGRVLSEEENNTSTSSGDS